MGLATKILKYGGYAFVGGIALSDTFEHKVERNLGRPIRNFIGRTSDRDIMEYEDLTGFVCDLGTGIGKMFIIEKRKDW